MQPFFLLACGAWALLSTAASAATDLGTAANPIKVCVQETRPYVFVDNSTGTPRVYGYEPDLFNALAKAQGYVSTTRVIVQFFDLLTGLELPETDPLHCDIGMSGMGTANIPISAGVKYSQTIFRNGMSVVTNVAVVRANDLWTFGRVFSKELWIALIVSAFALGLLVYAVERDFKQKGFGKIKYPMDVKPGLIESMFQSFSKLVNNVNGIPASSIAAKLMSLGWGLVILVCISSYTAGLTASLSIANFQSAITSYRDLDNTTNPGRVVGSWSYYADSGLFDRFGFRPIGLPWNSQPDVNSMIDKLAAHQLDAVVLDTGILRFNVGPRCDVQVVGSVFLYSEIAFAMHASVTPAFMNQFNDGLILLQEAGVNEDLESVYMPQQVCNPYNQISTAITFSMVRGVFIVLGILVGVGLLLALLPHISKVLEADSRANPGELRPDFSLTTRIKSVVSRLSFGKASKVEPDARDDDEGDDGRQPQQRAADLTVDVQPTSLARKQEQEQPVPTPAPEVDVPPPAAGPPVAAIQLVEPRVEPVQLDMEAVLQDAVEQFHAAAAAPPVPKQGGGVNHAPAHIEVVDY